MILDSGTRLSTIWYSREGSSAESLALLPYRTLRCSWTPWSCSGSSPSIVDPSYTYHPPSQPYSQPTSSSSPFAPSPPLPPPPQHPSAPHLTAQNQHHSPHQHTSSFQTNRQEPYGGNANESNGISSSQSSQAPLSHAMNSYSGPSPSTSQPSSSQQSYNQRTENPPHLSVSSSASSSQQHGFPASDTQRTLPPPASYQPTERPSLDSRRTSSNGLLYGGVPASETVESGWAGSATGNGPGGVPIQFDEGVLRQLCDLDCALPLLTERIKQSLASCKVGLEPRPRKEISVALSLRYLFSLGRLLTMSTIDFYASATKQLFSCSS